MPMGTAFAVSEDGLLVTALHVITAIEEQIAARGGRSMAAFAGPDYESGTISVHANFSLTAFDVVTRDPLNDLALLRLSRPLDELKVRNEIYGETLEAVPTVVTLESDAPLDGEMVAISGYPLREPSLVTTAGYIASNWTLDAGQVRYLADVTANPGNSGGPVYRLKDTKVVGVCVAGRLTNIQNTYGELTDLMQAADLTLVVPASAVSQLISQNA